MATAIWGLIGVAVRVVLTTIKDVIVERIRSTREQRRHAEVLARDVRTARRLVADEVDTLARNFRTLADLKRTPKQPLSAMPHFMPIDEWEQHKGVLAKVIDDPTWSELVVLYHNARSLRAKLTLDPTETPLTDEHVDSLARIADETGKLQETLAKPLEEGLEGKK